MLNWFNLDSLGASMHHSLLLGFTWSYCGPLGFVLLHLVSFGLIWSQLVPLDHTRFHWGFCLEALLLWLFHSDLNGLLSFKWVSLCCTRFHLVALGVHLVQSN